MAMISRLAVEKFRGINNLKIDNLNRINLFVGDNNCGKTSVMEALQLFRTSELLGNIYTIARQRESIFWMNSNSLYENFICMFPHDGSDLEINISGIYNDKTLVFKLAGVQKRIMVDTKELDRIMVSAFHLSGDMETDSFEGVISCKYGDVSQEETIKMDVFSGIYGTPTSESDDFRIVYVAPFEHLKGSVINQIIKNDGYKEI